MNPCKKARLLTSLLAFSLLLQGQEDSNFQNLYFVKKGYTVNFAADDYKLRKEGFYLYRNCIYMLSLTNKLVLMAKITDIKNDSIYYTPYSHLSVSTIDDTLALHPRQIRKIKLIGDRIMGLYTGYALAKHQHVFVNDPSPKRFATTMDTVYAKDSSRSTVYELVPYMTAQGLDRVYQQRGVTYYYEGSIPGEDKDDSTRVKKPYVLKKGVWFSPTNANEIRGVNIGLLSMTLRGDSFAVKGVNLNADLMAMLFTFPAVLYSFAGNKLINLPDTIDHIDMEKSISGLSVSAGGLLGMGKIQGVSVNGGICLATRAKGMVVTGTQNVVDDFRGVLIAGLRNRSIRGSGLQIGLFNICKHLKGVQIGLWNVNSKRKLPFINWSF